MDRLHAHGIKTYWTQRGAAPGHPDAADPDPDWDLIGRDIVVTIPPGGRIFTVR